MARIHPAAPGGWLRGWPDAPSQILASAKLVPARRVAVAHAVALLAILIGLAVDGPVGTEIVLTGLLIFVGFAALRVSSVSRTLATSTLILDAVGSALLLAGTGAPASAYFPLALAGAWWSAHIPRSRSGVVWAIAFIGAYGVLVLPTALGGRMLANALEDVSAVFIVALLSDWFVRVDRRAIQLSETLARAPAGAEEVAIRDGLTRALGPMEISVDVMLAAARAGLTVIQAELLAYLEMGLTNQEIADATNIGEASVRYRLTRLYRALGVKGRKAAVARAQQLGLAEARRGR